MGVMQKPNIKKRFIPLVCIIFVVLLFNACSKDEPTPENKMATDYDAKLLFDYFDQTCQIIRTTKGFFPPQAARAYGYIGIVAYEAVVHGIDGAQSLQNQIQGFSTYELPLPENGKTYNWAIACNAATAQMMRYMFDKNLTAGNRAQIENIETTYQDALSTNESTEIVDRSKSFGYAIADKMFEYSKTDGGHESYLDPFQLPYTIPIFDYSWLPTGAVTTPLSPRWGSNRAFIQNNVTKTNPGPPVVFSTSTTSEFYQQALTVYDQVKNNTSEQIEIAKYWADDPVATCTPAGHTFNILNQILKDENASLAKAALGFAKMGIAENDAFIACWKGKYEHLLLRPYTYITKYIDPTFKTVIGTPPFPAYTSGHSCEIGAGSRILTSLFTDGDGDYQFTDYTQLRYGFFARSFSNFEDMALECANSRLYGGIHFPMDNIKGLQLGRAVGDNVNRQINWPNIAN